MNDCVRYRFCYGTFGIIRQFFSMITLFPPFLPGIVPHKRYGILQLADYEPSGTTSSIASPKPLGISKPFHRVQNMRDCCTGDSLANNAPVFVKLPFWSLGHLGWWEGDSQAWGQPFGRVARSVWSVTAGGRIFRLRCCRSVAPFDIFIQQFLPMFRTDSAWYPHLGFQVRKQAFKCIVGIQKSCFGWS